MGADPLTLGILAGVVGGALIGSKGPKPPKPAAPPVEDKAQSVAKSAAAAKKQKQAAKGAYGSSDTMLTGGSGLGKVPAGNLQYSTVLGGGSG